MRLTTSRRGGRTERMIRKAILIALALAVAGSLAPSLLPKAQLATGAGRETRQSEPRCGLAVLSLAELCLCTPMLGPLST